LPPLVIFFGIFFYPCGNSFIQRKTLETINRKLNKEVTKMEEEKEFDGRIGADALHPSYFYLLLFCFPL